MKTKIAKRCLDILRGVNCEGIRYVLVAIKQEIEKNNFRSEGLKLSKERKK